MALLTFGSVDISEDEKQIRNYYKRARKELFGYGIPVLAIAYFADIKWVAAYGVVAMCNILCGIEGRLYDLAVRSRRTNILLNHEISN